MSSVTVPDPDFLARLFNLVVEVIGDEDYGREPAREWWQRVFARVARQIQISPEGLVIPPDVSGNIPETQTEMFKGFELGIQFGQFLAFEGIKQTPCVKVEMGIEPEKLQ